MKVKLPSCFLYLQIPKLQSHKMSEISILLKKSCIRQNLSLCQVKDKSRKTILISINTAIENIEENFFFKVKRKTNKFSGKLKTVPISEKISINMLLV